MDVQNELARGFIDTLFGGVPPGYHYQTWVRQQKTTDWTATGGESTFSPLPENDYYYCGALFDKALGPKQRGQESDVSGIVSFYADIDIAHELHKKSEYLPKTEEDAMSLLGECPLPPTIVLNSGHGLQAVWVLKEPFIFSSDEDRDRAKTLTTGWIRFIQGLASKKNWRLDSVFDLVRLGRIPGCINNKDPQDRRVVKLLGYDAASTWSVAELEAALALPASVRVLHKSERVQIEMPEDVNPEYLTTLTESHGEAAALVAGLRPTLSDSEADLVIGNMARAFFSANGHPNVIEAVTHVVRAFRLGRGKPEKANRASYVSGTVSRVMNSQPLLPQGEEVKTPQEATQEAPGAVDEEAVRKGALNIINVVLGLRSVKIARVVRLTAEEPEYILYFSNETSYRMGGVDKLLSPTAVGHAVADCARIIVILPKAARLEQLRTALLNAVEEETIGEEATIVGQGLAWVSQFLNDKPPSDEFDPLANSPAWITDDGHVAIQGSVLQGYVRMVMGEGQLGPKRFGMVMRAIGSKPFRVNVKGRTGMTTRNAWLLPAGVWQRRSMCPVGSNSENADAYSVQ